MTDLDAYHIKLIKKGLRPAEEGMGRKKKGSSRNVRKALKILAHAGKKNPLVLGDELP